MNYWIAAMLALAFASGVLGELLEIDSQHLILDFTVDLLFAVTAIGMCVIWFFELSTINQFWRDHVLQEPGDSHLPIVIIFCLSVLTALGPAGASNRLAGYLLKWRRIGVYGHKRRSRDR